MLASFYEAILPQSGQYALFTLNDKRHTWASDIPQLVKKTELLHAQQGVYFATASFVEPTKRTQDNVSLLRSLRLDIDAGDAKFQKHPEGAYPTQRSALEATVQFLKAAALAPSFVVSSGEGLHVYFALAEDIAPEVWTPLSTRLGTLCDEHGLKADKSVTTDTARVLRPIGMLHPNGSRVRLLKATGKVYTVEEITTLLGVAPVEVDTLSAGGRTFDLSINADVVRSVEGPPKSVIRIYEKCGAMREVMNAKGDVPEPYWRAMIGVMKHTVEGIDAAHEFSSGYDGYDELETEKKFNAWEKGPTTCGEFTKHSQACNTCPHAAKIKSPIQLGALNDAEVAQLPVELQPKEPEVVAAPGMPWDGKLPPRFQVVGGRGDYTLQYTMKVTKEDDNGAPVTSNVIVPVTKNIFWLGHWSQAVDSADKAMVSVHTYDSVAGTVHIYLMKQGDTANMPTLLTTLANFGISKSTDKKAAQAMSDFVTLELERIKAMAKRPKIAGRFGLRIDHKGDLLCAHGNHIIRGDGSIQQAMLTDELEKSMNAFTIPLPPSATGEWDKTVWSAHIKPLARDYVDYMKTFYSVPGLEKYQLAIMLGLASPLMAFVLGSYTEGEDLPPNALSVSLYSKGSGQGKTALVQAIMLAFGHPDRLVMESNSAGSTDMARLERLSLWGTFPTSMDEMGNTKEASITNMISAVANAKGKSRVKQGGGFTTTKSWALINLITTNRSQREMISVGRTDDSPAIQLRLLELDVDGVVFSKADRDAYSAAWSDVQRNTKGALGAIIHRAICKMGPKALNAALLERVKQADTFLQAEQGARFQYRALGALIFLHEMLEAMGLGMFDLTTLMDTFKVAQNY